MNADIKKGDSILCKLNAFWRKALTIGDENWSTPIGRKEPVIMNTVRVNKNKPITKRIILTDKLPTLLPAPSNPITVMDQKKAVPKLINYPKIITKASSFLLSRLTI